MLGYTGGLVGGVKNLQAINRDPNVFKDKDFRGFYKVTFSLTLSWHVYNVTLDFTFAVFKFIKWNALSAGNDGEFMDFMGFDEDL